MSNIEKQNSKVIYDKFDIGDDRPNKLLNIVVYLSLILEDNNISEKSCKDFLQSFIGKNKFEEEIINGVQFNEKNQEVIIYSKTGKEYSFSLDVLKQYVCQDILGGTNLESIELQTQAIHIAIESIFLDNTGVFDELDENDRFDVDKTIKMVRSNKIGRIGGKTVAELKVLLKPFQGKNLLELKEQLEPLEKKLLKLYDIRHETKKSIALLERQINHYTGIGDDYEGGARVFGMSSQNIDKMTEDIVNRKTVPELIEYIRKTNYAINKNSYISDIAKTMNLGVVSNLVQKTFDKMKKENSSNREFINFIQVITGRDLTDESGKLRTKKKQTRRGRVDIKEKEVRVDSDFAQTKIANKALIYLMYNRGIVDKISEKQKLQLEDEVFTERKVVNSPILSYTVKGEKLTSISTIMNQALQPFEDIGLDRNEIVKSMKLEKIQARENTFELSFEEMLLLGALYRISKDIKDNIKNLKGKSAEEIQQFLQEKNNEALADAFKELNENFEKNFSALLLDWNGINSHQVGLEGDFAEIFDLYGEINGRGIFNLADDNWFAKNFLNATTGVVLAVGVLTAMIVLSPAVMAAGGMSLAIAGAKIGVTTTIASQLMSKKGYDTMGEAAAGITTQAAVDIISSSTFTVGSGYVITKVAQIVGPKFASTLAQEIKLGQVSDRSKKILGEVLKDGEIELGKKSSSVVGGAWQALRTSPERLWRPQLESVVQELNVLKQAGFKGTLSENTIKYIAKYRAINSGIGQGADMFIGVGDGVFSSVVWSILERGAIDRRFAENHFNPDVGETFLNVHEKRKQAEELSKQAEVQREKLEGVNKQNPNLQQEYNELSEDEKTTLYYVLALTTRNGS